MTAVLLLLAVLALAAVLLRLRCLSGRTEAVRPAQPSHCRRIPAQRTPEGAKEGEAISGRQGQPAAEASSPAQLVSAGTPNTDGSPRAGECGHLACAGSIDLEAAIDDALAISGAPASPKVVALRRWAGER